MRKPTTFFLLLLFLSMTATGLAWSQEQDADKISRALLDRVTRPYVAALLLDRKHADHPLKLILNTRKQVAYLTAMGHELFRMRARPVDLSPAGLSIADNWWELQANTREKVYLDIAGKTLSFRGRGNIPSTVFAHLEIEPPLSPHTRHVLVARLLDHHPMEFHVLNYKKALVLVDGRKLFVMHAKKIKIRGSSVPLVQLKYKKRYRDGIYLNPSRRILFFRSGRKGVFAKVKVDSGRCFIDSPWEIDWNSIPE